MAVLQIIQVYTKPDEQGLSEEALSRATQLLIENEKTKLNATALMSLGYVSATAGFVAVPGWLLTMDAPDNFRFGAICAFIVGAAALSIGLFFFANRKLKELR